MTKSLMIIGGGPAGYETAIYAAKKGFSVTLAEKHLIGGTCLNYGCIPTKAMLKHSEVIELLRKKDTLGILFDGYTLDYPTMVQRRQNVIEDLQKGIMKQLKSHNVRILSGTAQILNNTTVSVQLPSGETVVDSYDSIILATGSSPRVIQGIDMQMKHVYTSDDIFNMNELPQTLAIIGGGVIGMEFARIYERLGVKIIMIEYEKEILSMIDADIRKRFKPILKKSDIEIHTSAQVISINEDNNVLHIEYLKDDRIESLSAHAVLIATGRIGNFSQVEMDKLGILHAHNFITVSNTFETSQSNIYAIGDINGISLLAHSAVNQGRQLIDYLTTNIQPFQALIPSCIFTDPEIASVGLTEEACSIKKIGYRVGKALYGSNGKAYASLQTEGLLKIITDDNDYIIGMHLLGAHASDIIHYAVIAIEGKLTINQLSQLVFAHPTLGELFIECVRDMNEKI